MAGGDGASPSRTRLAVVFVQYDREKYRRALPALVAALDRLSAEKTFVVVDNAVTGDWSHSVSATFHHVGGDNSSWEFSAFARGLGWLREHGVEADVYALATDAVLAYGDDFLGLLDDAVIDCCRRIPACAGWIDSFIERCEVLGYSYDSWIRTSLLLVPEPVLPRLEPLAPALDDDDLFGADPRTPFRPAAPLSGNLRRLLLEWLTVGQEGPRSLGWAWHSRFRLDADSFGLFKGKVKAILREHLLSARLRAAGVRCLDLRAIRRLGESGSLDAADGDPQWDWLGWIPAEEIDDGAAASAGDGTAGGEPAPAEDAGPEPPPGNRAIRFFERQVLPLVLQRHPHASILDAAGDGGGDDRRPVALAEPAAGTVALLLPPGEEPSVDTLHRAADLAVPLVGARPSGLVETVDGRHYLHAERPWEYATACCRLLEDAGLRASMGRSLKELVGANGGL